MQTGAWRLPRADMLVVHRQNYISVLHLRVVHRRRLEGHYPPTECSSLLLSLSNDLSRFALHAIFMAQFILCKIACWCATHAIKQLVCLLACFSLTELLSGNSSLSPSPACLSACWPAWLAGSSRIQMAVLLAGQQVNLPACHIKILLLCRLG